MTPTRSSLRAAIAAALTASLVLTTFVVAPSFAQNAEKAPGKKGQNRMQVAQRKMWWNDTTVVAQLKLTQDVRDKMDSIYAAYEAKVAEAGKTPGQLRNDFVATLQTGDKAAQTRALETWADGARLEAELEGRLRMDVLSLLDAEQHKTLLDIGRQIYQRPWKPRAQWPLKRRQKSS